MRLHWDNEALTEVVDSVLLPDWQENWDATPDRVFKLETLDKGWSVQMGDDSPEVHLKLDQLKERLKTLCHLDLGSYSPEGVFVHAGVALTDFGLVVIPARSYCGKSTLVKSLVELGARYYSDEYAVITEDGMVHPFPRALSMRIPGSSDEKTAARKLGWSQDLKAAPMTTVLCTRFKSEGLWEPNPLSEGQAVLKLLENTVSAQINPEKAIRYLTAAVSGTQAIETDRGEAAEAARLLLEFMAASV